MVGSGSRFSSSVRGKLDHDQIVAVGLNFNTRTQVRQTDDPRSGGHRSKLSRVGAIFRFGPTEPAESGIAAGESDGLVNSLKDVDTHYRTVARRGIRRAAHNLSTPAHNGEDRSGRGGNAWFAVNYIRGLPSKRSIWRNPADPRHKQQSNKAHHTRKPETLQLSQSPPAQMQSLKHALT